MDFCDIDYYTDILEDDVTHKRQPFYLNVFMCNCLISKKKKPKKTQKQPYNLVTSVDVYISVLL